MGGGGGGGRGLLLALVFHTQTFCSGTHNALCRQNAGGQSDLGQNAGQYCKRE